ncbi:hypothetical protein FRC09_008054 [Ceratobasidium sp. 395]|nr:hypothetical protein FRC09_008054 [Ceratobasidium sp. 395]
MTQETFHFAGDLRCSSLLEYESAIQSALTEWKAARALLSSTIQSYLVACATLHAMCIRPSSQAQEHFFVEEAFKLVDLELRSMTFEEDELRDTRILLSKMRNTSTRLALANTLPVEILEKIFLQSRTYCAHDSGAKLSYNALTGVSTYWRRVAINTPELWTHIDVGPDISTQSLAKVLLGRTRDIPVYMHVFEPTVSGDSAITKLTGFLAPFINRVCSLDLETYSHSRNLAKSVIDLWIKRGSSMLRELTIYRPNGSEVLRPTNPRVTEGQRKTLPALQILHLHSSKFSWDSPVYHGLVDLRIQGDDFADIEISALQLANVLAMSPDMASLRLWRVRIAASRGWVPTPIVLGRLHVLNLVHLFGEGVGPVLPLISQPNPAAQLCVGLSLLDGTVDEFKAFCSRSCIHTLFCDTQCLSAVFQVSPRLDISHLVLNNPGIHWMYREDAPPASTLIPLSQVSQLTLLWCVLTVETLVKFVAHSGIKALRLESCLLANESDNKLAPFPLYLQAALIEASPGVECIISDTDTLRQLPCRIGFDRCAEMYMGHAQVPYKQG